jgi:hypothetical protein
MRHLLKNLTQPGTGHDSALWPVLLLLLVVLVPSAGVVWMMRAAMENERFAVRQRLVEAYRAQLAISQQRVEDAFQQRLNRLDAHRGEQTPAQAFATCAKENTADAVIILDDHGKPLYPAAPATTAVPASVGLEWAAAERLESAQNLAAAAKAFAEIAAQPTGSPIVAARARQAEARLRVQLNDLPGAIRALQHLSGSDNPSTPAAARSPPTPNCAG